MREMGVLGRNWGKLVIDIHTIVCQNSIKKLNKRSNRQTRRSEQMTEKQQAFFNDLLKTAMASMDKMVETNGAVRGNGEMVFNKVKMHCMKRGFAIDYSIVRSGMQDWLTKNVPAEQKSIDYLKDWAWVRDFVKSIDDPSIYLTPDTNE